jgi:hypothetical protein
MEAEQQSPTCPECKGVVEQLYQVCADTEACLRRQILNLKQSIVDWKDAWFHLRDIIGEISWQHRNCPHQNPPPADPIPNSWLHIDETIVQIDNLVYRKVGQDWKLIGAGKTQDSAEAIFNLMKD